VSTPPLSDRLDQMIAVCELHWLQGGSIVFTPQEIEDLKSAASIVRSTGR